MTPTVTSPRVVREEDLRVGDLLAEGGEGRVYQLPRQPHLVFKSYRQPTDRAHLDDLVAWPDGLASPEAAHTVRNASAWPCSVVAGPGGRAVGLLMPRAPRRFALRHRDGHSRLASLSYLTSDPEHRAVAYGLQLPRPASADRVGLVYALARLLAAFESGDPAVGHGDLSTKNVLWSLQRGPEVFVIDCDSSERFGGDGHPLDRLARRRAMTPNWDDPAVPRGQNPTRFTDRYSLGLVFLRVVGSANFPIQARQRGGGEVEVRFQVPAGRGAAALLDPGAPIWDLCARSLSLSAVQERPPASAWLGPLEALLDSMGAADTMRAVWAVQGPGRPSPVVGPTGEAPADIRIIPEKAPKQARTWSHVSPGPRYGDQPQPAAAATVGYRWVPLNQAPAPVDVPPKPPGQLWPELREQLSRFLGWWWSIHHTRQAWGVALCLVVDFVILVLGGALVALIISPIIQS